MYPTTALDQWYPDVPGKIEYVYLHWSAHDYASVFPAYHFCIVRRDAGSVVVATTHDVRENMRDVYDGSQRPYAQHTRGRNSFAIGISAMAMEGATPYDFGKYPMTAELVTGLAVVTARLASFYEIPIDAEHVMTHAEAAIVDGYFGTAEHERWDLARLAPLSVTLERAEAVACGNYIRSLARSY